MANFELSVEKTIHAEGGYVYDPDDPGGETYKGVARTRNPGWSGWAYIDQLKQQRNFPHNLETSAALQEKVRALYKSNYWDKVQGDKIIDQDIAESIYDFAVNAGPRTSVKLAQVAAQTADDGIIGPQTLEKINTIDKRTFLAVFALAKIRRYVALCETRRTSRKYFFGWVRRSLSGWTIIRDGSSSLSNEFPYPIQQEGIFNEEQEQLEDELLRASRAFATEQALCCPREEEGQGRSKEKQGCGWPILKPRSILAVSILFFTALLYSWLFVGNTEQIAEKGIMDIAIFALGILTTLSIQLSTYFFGAGHKEKT